jgi:hypothetical protein
MRADACENARVSPDWQIEDFTEASYRELVATALERYAFEPFGTSAAGPHVLWRHDVDYSVHRAVALARLEAELGARATYFISLHSDLYNVLEPAVHDRLREIAALGHWIGLHFDAGFAASGSLDDRAAWEARVLSEALALSVEVISLHNPSVSGTQDLDVEELGGMRHAGARSVRDAYAYISDSNGYWRFERLPEVIAAGAHERLHVLTHPEWWQEEAMAPRDRILRSIEGRARAAEATYDALLADNGRVNVGSAAGAAPTGRAAPGNPGG